MSQAQYLPKQTRILVKDLDFIETKLVDMPSWNTNQKVRVIKLTSKAKDYNNHLILPTQDKAFVELKKEIKKSNL
ncbi:MAG: hypothetical protein QM493_08555 [Sulfurovum sp.]